MVSRAVFPLITVSRVERVLFPGKPSVSSQALYGGLLRYPCIERIRALVILFSDQRNPSFRLFFVSFCPPSLRMSFCISLIKLLL